jgi:ABC-2 type transport system ATP-binding protein
MQPGDTDVKPLLMEGVSRDFNGVHALRDVSLSVDEGVIAGLLGPDGAGKSTLLAVASGTLRPTGGEVLVFGKPPQEAKTLLSYVPMTQGLYDDLTPIEHLTYLADLYHADRKRIDYFLEMAGLSSAKTRLIGQLSGGMRQKLALVAGFLHDPRLLLLDEPTRGIDPIFRQEVWSMLYRMAGAGKAVLLTTSSSEEAERLSLVFFMKKGEIMARGSPQELKQGLSGRVFVIRGDEAGAYRSLRQRGIRARMAGDGVRCIAEKGQLSGFDFSEAEPSLGDVFLGL